MSQTSKRTFHPRLTFEEVVECRRALQLIMQEDASADVNMDEESVRNKQSALDKLTRIVGESGSRR